MRRFSGNIWPIPGTPGTRPGTRKRPCEAPFIYLFPVFPVKIQFPYAREKFILAPSSAQIKFSAYITSKLPGTPGTPGTSARNALVMRVFVFPVLFPVAVLFPVIECGEAQ